MYVQVYHGGGSLTGGDILNLFCNHAEEILSELQQEYMHVLAERRKTSKQKWGLQEFRLEPEWPLICMYIYVNVYVYT